MKKRFTFVYEFLRGGWSFLCIYADTTGENEGGAVRPWRENRHSKTIRKTRTL